MKNLVVLLFFIPLFAVAQKTHTVKPKETLYSLARLYNVHPRELATYNDIPVGTSLVLGQVIKIPAKTTMEPLSVPAPVNKEPEVKNETIVKKEPEAKKELEVKKEPVAKTPVTAKKEELTPIYHKVAKKETLYGISKQYPNITIDDIRKWNKLSGDGLSEGSNLVVGYRKAGTTEEVKENKPAEIKTIVKETPKATEPEKKEPEQVVKTEPVKKEQPAVEKKEEPTGSTGKSFNGGAFKNVYEKQVIGKAGVSEERGQAGVFKSTSGWEDGKYYCLSNTAPAGSIVKITNPSNNKSVYAKVLDVIPDLKQNVGIIVRLSNAAASELGVSSDNFESTINF